MIIFYCMYLHDYFHFSRNNSSKKLPRYGKERIVIGEMTKSTCYIADLLEVASISVT